MSHTFNVSLSSTTINSIWGEKSQLSFVEGGAVIHIESLSDAPSELEKIQKAARQLAKMNVNSIVLTGEWSLEAQWHFWQGSYSPKSLGKIEFASLSNSDRQLLDNRIKTIQWTRNLINKTPEDLPPVQLAEETATFIQQLEPASVNFNIISGEELNTQGYVGIYGVGRGSERPPALLVLDYCPTGCEDEAPAAALVGKGITFDSGGYSLKSTLGMLHMKADMGGAATVAGALALAILNGLKKRVKLYLCCAENLVSGHAYKLSDILTYRNGVSVEVVNTDAEGRLVLADGLIDASKSLAPVIIDAATLTGAAVVAVGEDYNAMFTMDDRLADDFNALAIEHHDPSWRLPLSPAHQKNCPSSYADTANSKPVPGGGAGGASNAAGFLSRFLDTPEQGWLHLDLAACYRNSGNESWSAGATGKGVRSIAAFLNQL